MARAGERSLKQLNATNSRTEIQLLKMGSFLENLRKKENLHIIRENKEKHDIWIKIILIIKYRSLISSNLLMQMIKDKDTDKKLYARGIIIKLFRRARGRRLTNLFIKMVALRVRHQFLFTKAVSKIYRVFVSFC